MIYLISPLAGLNCVKIPKQLLISATPSGFWLCQMAPNQRCIFCGCFHFLQFWYKALLAGSKVLPRAWAHFTFPCNRGFKASLYVMPSQAGKKLGQGAGTLTVSDPKVLQQELCHGQSSPWSEQAERKGWVCTACPWRAWGTTSHP